jgi:hypothetical protein
VIVKVIAGTVVVMAYQKDPAVDAYIAPLPDWQQRICQEVRDIVHEADPEVEETIKRTVQPYFRAARELSSRCSPRRTTSRSSSTTAASRPIPTASLPAATATRPAG